MSDQNHNDRAGKSDFDSIYNRDDPRAYFRTLAPLKYSAPAHGTPIFRNCADKIADLREKPQIDVLDLCCGYGINGALLKHDIDLKDIYSRYASKDSAALSPADLVEADKQFFAEVEAQGGPIDEIIGIDVAENAVAMPRRWDSSMRARRSTSRKRTSQRQSLPRPNIATSSR